MRQGIRRLMAAVVATGFIGFVALTAWAVWVSFNLIAETLGKGYVLMIPAVIVGIAVWWSAYRVVMHRLDRRNALRGARRR